MTGGGFRSFTAGEVLTAANVQDFFMDQAVMNFAGTAARASAIPSPSAGMVSHIGGGTVQVYNGTAWVALGGVPNAVLSNTPTGTYSAGTPSVSYAYYTFTASGTATVTTAGYADILVVAGGGGGRGNSGFNGGGGGGEVHFGGEILAVQSYTVTVGAGGAASVDGSTSSLGTVRLSNGGQGGSGFSATGGPNVDGYSSSGAIRTGSTGSNYGGGAGGLAYGATVSAGITLSYSGSATEYGAARRDANAGTANLGQGAGAGQLAGGSGVVIIRVRT